MVEQERQTKKSTALKEQSIIHVSPDQSNNQLQRKAGNIPTDPCAAQPSAWMVINKKTQKRKLFSGKRKEKRQRISDDRGSRSTKRRSWKGNVKAAMDIFENLRKREELKVILSQVQEMEGDTSDVDVGSMKMLFENVPAWIATPSRTARKKNRKEEKKVEMEMYEDDLESTSSVETAFEDLKKQART